MNTTARLTIPIDKTLRAKLDKQAAALGFDSPQALLRYVSKAIVDGRHITFGRPVDEWGPVPEHVVKRWEKESAEHRAARAAGKVKSYTDMDDLMVDLLDEKNQRSEAG